MDNFLTRLFKTSIPNTGRNYRTDNIPPNRQPGSPTDEEWLEFECWSWLRITSSGQFDYERSQQKWKIACEEHEKRVKKLKELNDERSRVNREMMDRGASIEELRAYEDSVYPEIHMWLMASRSLY